MEVEINSKNKTVHINLFFIASILPPTHLKVDQICMKLDENEVKLNLNDR